MVSRSMILGDLHWKLDRFLFLDNLNKSKQRQSELWY